MLGLEKPRLGSTQLANKIGESLRHQKSPRYPKINGESLSLRACSAAFQAKNARITGLVSAYFFVVSIFLAQRGRLWKVAPA